MAVIRSIIAGCGGYLPEQSLTNDELSRRGVETSDEWVVQRTGIKSRHIAKHGEFTSDLATHAAIEAIKNAGITPDEIDAIFLATTTPDSTMPATATKVQANLGMTRGFAFDIQAVCSGFVYATATADNFIRAGQIKTALVIGAETLSRIVDWGDRSTCVLFGDGAGAMVLQASVGKGNKFDRGILSTHLHSDGRHYNMLYTDGGPSTTKSTGYIRMHGQEVFRHAVANLSSIVDEALSLTGLAPEDIDWLIPHQANSRIIESNAKKLKLPPERVVMTVAHHANTSAASIPMALSEAINDGRLKKGQLLMLNSMGAGFTWGSIVVRL